MNFKESFSGVNEIKHLFAKDYKAPLSPPPFLSEIMRHCALWAQDKPCSFPFTAAAERQSVNASVRRPGAPADRVSRSVGRLGVVARAAALAVLGLAALAVAVPERAQAQTLEETRRSGDCRDLSTRGPNCGIGSSIDRRAEGYRDGGAIQSASDGDLWSVILERGQTYEIEVKGDGDLRGDNGGTLADPYVEIYEMDWSERTGWSGALRASNDNARGTNKNARVTYTYPDVNEPQTPIGIRVSGTSGSTGSYTVSVRALQEGEIPEVLSQVTETTDCAADTSTTCSITIPGVATGDLPGSDGDGDYWKATLEEGKVYEIDLEGLETGKGTLPDPRMYLLDSTDMELVQNDDISGDNYNSRFIRFVPSGEGGTYFIHVDGSFSSDTGTYTLTVREHALAEPLTETGNCGEDGTTSCSVTIGSRVTGGLQGEKDAVDSWLVTLDASKTYQIEIEPLGAAGLLGAKARLYTKTGNSQFGSDGEENSPIIYTVLGGASGVYRVEVSDSYFLTGLYALTVTEITRFIGTRSMLAEENAPPLTAQFAATPYDHDGTTAFSVNVRFSDAIATSAEQMRASIEITGGSATGTERLSVANQEIWRITVTPAGNADVVVRVPVTSECSGTGAICASGGRGVSEAISTTVFRAGLLGYFVDMPPEHDGSSTFTFEIHFSEAPKLSYRTVRNQLFTVDGGNITRARRVTKGSNLAFEVTVEPDGLDDVALSVAPTSDCAASAAVCTRDGRPMQNPLRTTVPGP